MAGLAAILLGLAFLLPACDTFPIDNNWGVSLSTDGRDVLIHYSVCVGGALESAQAGTVKGNIIGDDDPLFWHVIAPGGHVTDETVVVGVLPAGFAEVIPLERPVTAFGSRDLFVLMETVDDFELGVSFRMANLSKTKVKTGNGELISMAELSKRVSEVCNS